MVYNFEMVLFSSDSNAGDLLLSGESGLSVSVRGEGNLMSGSAMSASPPPSDSPFPPPPPDPVTANVLVRPAPGGGGGGHWAPPPPPHDQQGTTNSNGDLSSIGGQRDNLIEEVVSTPIPTQELLNSSRYMREKP